MSQLLAGRLQTIVAQGFGKALQSSGRLKFLLAKQFRLHRGRAVAVDRRLQKRIDGLRVVAAAAILASGGHRIAVRAAASP